LSTDRLLRLSRRSRPEPGASPEHSPLAVVAKVKNAVRVVSIDRRAEKRGIRTGQSLADARGAVPDLRVVESDEDADGALLEAIADWCDRYTPLVALDPPRGLFLDISGCAHLFSRSGEDGEAVLLADCLHRLASRGFEARGAIAATAGAAWALAHYAGGGCIAPGAEAEALGPLPVAALRITGEQEDLLDRLGLKRIGQLIGKPRAPLAARFGTGLVRRLDQALGREDEVLSPRRPAPQLSAERRFTEPVVDQAPLLDTVASLARTLASALERQGLGARLLEASFFRTDGHVVRIAVGTAAPIRAAEAVAMLFSERLSTLGDWDAGFGFDTVRLAVTEAEALAAIQIDLSGTGSEGPDLASLVDRLGARLGAARITRFHPVDSHSPERAILASPLAGTLHRAAKAALGWNLPEFERESQTDRPLRLFVHPEPVEEVIAEVPDGPPARFRWRRVLYEIVRAEGPERIAPEWWRPDGRSRATRDYYRVEDQSGRRYWLFREGLYGREEIHPTWYLHGLFG
jgi:protein ImuB